jgi:hypothetical protein
MDLIQRLEKWNNKHFLLPATLTLVLGFAGDAYWRTTDQGQDWLFAVEERSLELDRDPSLSNYEKTATIVSEFYGLR